MKTTPAGMCSIRGSCCSFADPQIRLWNWNPGPPGSPLPFFSKTATSSRLISPESHDEEGRSFLASLVAGWCWEEIWLAQFWSFAFPCINGCSYENGALTSGWIWVRCSVTCRVRVEVGCAKHISYHHLMDALEGSLNLLPTSRVGANISSTHTVVKEE